MRAMILAAGLGTRMRPLSDFRAKPALPVRGRPVISLLLELLARQGCSEVMINLHHLGSTVRAAVAADHPSGIQVHWSEEPRPLGTGGGIRRAAEFLSASEACIVLAGDMLFDAPLPDLFARHRESGRAATLLLLDDPRAERFGTIGVDAEGRPVRIGRWCPDPSAETSRGLFTGVRLFSSGIFDSWPASNESENDPAFEDLRDWLVPAMEQRGVRVGTERLDPASTVWEPVGTPSEYLHANLSPPVLPTLGDRAEAWQGEVDLLGASGDVIVSRKAFVPEDTLLERCVVWDGERVPSGFRARDGVYAGGAFHACAEVGAGSTP